MRGQDIHFFIYNQPSSRNPKIYIHSLHSISYIMERKTCIAMVPSPELSHLIPLVELARRLVLHHHDLHVTLLIPTLVPLTASMKALLNTLPPNTNFTVLPQVKIEDLPHNINPVTKWKLIVQHSTPFIHEALTSLISSTRLVALVYDMFSFDAHHVAKKLNLLSYLFFISGAVVLSFSLSSFPKLDESVCVSSEFLSDSIETVNVPGCAVAFHVKELPEPVLYGRSSETYRSVLDVFHKISLVDGVLVNTFTDLEAGAIRALQEREGPCVYPVGPIIMTESSSEENKLLCLRWLNNQPPSSVLYVSFGSVGTLSYDLLNELAFGLEMSGHKFLWVVRAPLEYLPSGFLDRTKTQGLVVTSWAPQIEILGHASTGGFLSHCGWSSTLESVVNGVPMIVWPLFAEQRMNAKIITDALKIGVRPKVDGETGMVKREEIARGVKRIMEGDESLEICRRVKELSDGAAAALSEHGSSRNAISSLALKWNNL
ncbi:hydroquinone glucosyltransferase-like [Lotus japonicus]|uniref:hydroquinone glucosyltransferase-like n=1 Tax=Lotus japonicus TaxID=34305 RepID=UPI00258D97C4|nr:hydroquinone glucosyltransferase-like [Lotus japonicus]